MPLALQLMPDIPIVFDDDSVIPGLTSDDLILSRTTATASSSLKNCKFCWLVACGTAFLMQAQEPRRVLASSDNTLIPLMRYVLQATGRLHADGVTVSAGGDDDPVTRAAQARKAAPVTAHGHVYLV